mmetsp:Transcript_50043/g.109423  ORF Transcript_50043/g.109423 Transcript_50043/m.109423 type:complete len:659 (+) Transcript_50043:309-2285(+)
MRVLAWAVCAPALASVAVGLDGGMGVRSKDPPRPSLSVLEAGPKFAQVQEVCSTILMYVGLLLAGCLAAWMKGPSAPSQIQDTPRKPSARPKAAPAVVVEPDSAVYMGVYAKLTDRDQDAVSAADAVRDVISSLPGLAVDRVEVSSVEWKESGFEVDLIVLPVAARKCAEFTEQVVGFASTLEAAAISAFGADKVVSQETHFSVSIEGGSVAVSFAADFDDEPAELLKAIKTSAPNVRKLFQSCLRLQWKKLLLRQPATVQRTARLMKWWMEHQTFSSVFHHPPPRLMEAATIYASATTQYRSISELMAATRAVLLDLPDAKITWGEGLARFSIYAPAEVQRNVRSQKPMLMDPVNPYNNLANKRIFGCEELVGALREARWWVPFRESGLCPAEGEMAVLRAQLAAEVVVLPLAAKAGLEDRRPKSAWRPGTASTLQRSVQSVLNKITEENFKLMAGKLVETATSDVVQTSDDLDVLARVVFTHATREPRQCFAPLYADLLQELTKQCPSKTRGNGLYSFKQALLDCFQTEFEKLPDPTAVEDQDWPSMEEKQVAYNKAKDKGMGLVVLLGEMFNRTVVSRKVVTHVVERLLLSEGSVAEHSLEMGIRVLGLVKEKIQRQEEGVAMVQACRARMVGLAEAGPRASRVGFMLMDALEML